MKNKKVLLTDVVWFQEGPGVRNTQYTDSGVKLLNVANLVDGKVDLTTSSRYISKEEAYGKYKHFLVDQGDFIIASSGIKVDYFDKKMGFVDKTQLPLCMNTSTIRFKALDSNVLNIRYFMYYLKSFAFKEQLTRQITGSAQLNFGPSHLKKMTMLLPLIEEQEKICKKLDTVYHIIETRQRQLIELDNLIKFRFVEMFGDCKINPKGWKTRCLEEIAEVGSSRRVFVEELQETGIPFYRGTEIGALAEGKKITPELFITEKQYAKLCRATGKPQTGDLLMPSICPDGRIWMVNTDKPFYFKDGRVLWIHAIDRNYNPVFLLYTLKDRIMSDYSSIASGTTFAELKIFALKKCRIFDVPITLQNEFAAFVTQTDKSKLIIQKSLDELETLNKALMQKYFGGNEVR